MGARGVKRLSALFLFELNLRAKLQSMPVAKPKPFCPHGRITPAPLIPSCLSAFKASFT